MKETARKNCQEPTNDAAYRKAICKKYFILTLEIGERSVELPQA